jgi:hypothetical protein
VSEAHDELGLMSAWFAGPKAENSQWFNGWLGRIAEDYCAWRRNYFPEDGVVVDSTLRRHNEPFMDAFEDRLLELLARLNALARRPPLTQAATVLRVGDLEMDLLKRSVTRGGQRIELQPREFRLLEYLMQRAGQVVTRTMLLEGVWDFHFDPKTSVVETHISRLRAKLDQPGAPALIHTMRGAGYCLRAPD